MFNSRHMDVRHDLWATVFRKKQRGTAVNIWLFTTSSRGLSNIIRQQFPSCGSGPTSESQPNFGWVVKLTRWIQ